MTEETMADETDKATADPVRKWTLILLGVAAFMMIWYIISDRITPYTSQARVHALIVPVAPEVSGLITEVAVKSNQAVEAGDLLFSIDRTTYELAVETAEANLQAARQATGASGANVDVARAQLKSAQAGLVKAEQDALRMRRIKEEDPGAISERRLQMAEASYAVAKSQVEAAQANLDRAIQDFGESGEDNSRILEAQSALEQAKLNLDRTSITAPADGVVTDVRVDRGNFANAGAPLMTFLASHDIWVQADFTENNLGNIKPGDEVRIVFDALPGRVVRGNIRTTGFGVAVDSAPLGSLPTIDNQREWLRDEQRFAVIIDFELPSSADRMGIRVGAQASVMVLTGNSFLFNTWGKVKIRFVSWLTYAY
ncbi:MAG: biotin/lipoyl-binding protein [Woeseiaceae bacterium]|nr:biotin/lipoyl-binding protein [Woeseiaceae bacterium]NIP21861.1 biotin/lipoyl-binding protein [Woeseiaceae bacterium]NIS90946.1 biotin/lipoyl-binding protein [Woeseiaceae bacterium]